VFGICLFSQSIDAADSFRFGKSALQTDFLQMRQTLEENHAALYAYISKPEMDSLMDHLYSQIQDSMAIHEFFVLLTPIVARIGCGHTNVWMPMFYWDHKPDFLFPLQIRLIGDKAVVAGGYGEAPQIPRGSVILQINGRPMEEIIAEMKVNYPADARNPYFIEKAVERRFPMIYTRRFGYHSSYRIIYTLPGNQSPSIATLRPAENEAVREVVFKNFRQPELSLTLLQDDNCAVLKVESFIFYDRVPFFSGFIDSCFQVIQDKRIKNLILDLRGNDGGDPFCAVPLFAHLEPEPLPYFAEPYGKYSEFANPIPRAENAFSGNLLVFLDGRCFSTNGHFCALLKYHHIGRFIGTPSGATYICNAGRNTQIDLDSTRIMLYFGRSSFAAAVEGMDKAKPIMPDIPVRETYSDFLAGRDPYMEAAMRLLDNEEY
jgi:hypothetical protein